MARFRLVTDAEEDVNQDYKELEDIGGGDD